MVAYNFNAQQYEPSTGAADVLETGVYSVQIIASEVKQTKKGDGHMLVLTLSCLDPQVAGRKLTARLNIHNPSAQAMEIAHRELSAISHVVGLLNWQDTQQLHGRPFKVSVEKVARDDRPGSFNNNIIAYMDYAGNPPNQNAGAAGSSQIPAAPQPPVGGAPAPAAQPPIGQPPYNPAQGHAPAPAPAAAPDAAPWQQGAAAPAPAPAQAPQQPSGAAPWMQGAPAPAAAPAAGQQPWAGQPAQQPPAGQQPWAGQQPAAGAPTPPWAQQ